MAERATAQSRIQGDPLQSPETLQVIVSNRSFWQQGFGNSPGSIKEIQHHPALKYG